MTVPSNLICTVGTSLLFPNLRSLPEASQFASWLARQPDQDQVHLTADLVGELSAATKARDADEVAKRLSALPGSVRLAGAEINSITDLIAHQWCESAPNLFFFHSDTDDGKFVADVLASYYRHQRFAVHVEPIKHLQDQSPKDFRTKGLRNLAKTVSRIIRERSAPYCAINATGGYKAQIAIAVVMGQALRVPVYYKHERFSEIIAFPPLPVSLDQQLWMRWSGLFTTLSRQDEDMLPAEALEIEDWDERLETLVEREEIDGTAYMALSPTGQIFHESFIGRFASERDRMLPPPVPENAKTPPRLGEHDWANARRPVTAFMERVVAECPYVKTCRTHYWNPRLSRANVFRPWQGDIEGIYSNGTWTVKIVVETDARTPGQIDACVADLNARLEEWRIC